VLLLTVPVAFSVWVAWYTRAWLPSAACVAFAAVVWWWLAPAWFWTTADLGSIAAAQRRLHEAEGATGFLRSLQVRKARALLRLARRQRGWRSSR
jgi:hypothetical protein